MRRTHSPRWNRSEPSAEPPDQMMGPGICGRGPSVARRNLNSFRQKRLNWKTGQRPRLRASAEAAETYGRTGTPFGALDSAELVRGTLPLLWFASQVRGWVRSGRRAVPGILIVTVLFTSDIQQYGRFGTVPHRFDLWLEPPRLSRSTVLMILLHAPINLWARAITAVPQHASIAHRCPDVMLWTAPPPARECHGCGCC
jgi:hypothetical protein